jgi:dihydrodipicolinate synthase/N-acetylneuraminate lyase
VSGALPEGIRVRPRRRIRGLAAILLPFDAGGAIDWRGLAGLIERSAAAGLLPAVNLHAGFAEQLDEGTRLRAVEVARRAAPRGFAAGAHVHDAPGAAWDRAAYAREMERIAGAGGIPLVFPSHGLSALDDGAWVVAHRELAEHCERFIACELDPAFAPQGRMREGRTYRGLLGIPQCIGAHLGSASRALEWERLALRDRHRPDFHVLSGNERALDMVTYGSDYLLALAGLAPEAFARRDALWASGDPGFHELNDLLQYLGSFVFRAPLPAYRHSAAMFLALRGWIACDATHASAGSRPASDAEVLSEIAQRLGVS